MNHRRFALCLSAVVLLVSCASQVAVAQMMPAIGYRTSLSTRSHDVSGTVTIVDEDTILVEDFVYDGGGLSVFFYLGTSEDSFESGLEIGPQLVGTVYDGTQDSFTIDLPEGMTVEGYNAVSVWCVIANVSFGEGTFADPSFVLLGDVNLDGAASFLDVPPFIAILASGEFQAQADLNQDGAVTFLDIAPMLTVLTGIPTLGFETVSTHPSPAKTLTAFTSTRTYRPSQSPMRPASQPSLPKTD